MITANSVAEIETDDGYGELESSVRRRIANLNGPVFTTDADSDQLWKVWIEGIPAHRRQHYNCTCCRNFIRKYGGLVTVNEHNAAVPLIWEQMDIRNSFFDRSIGCVEDLLLKSKIGGVFLWTEKEKVWGTPKTRVDPKPTCTVTEWTHLSGTTTCKCFSSPLLTAAQAMAEKREDFGILCRPKRY